MANKKNKQIEQHEDLNLHIKKRTALGLVGTGLMSAVCYGWCLVLVDCWKFLGLDTPKSAYQLMFVPMLVIAFGLAGLLEYCVISIFRKYSTDSLVYGLVVGPVFGLVFGLVVGLLYGLVVGLVFGLVVGLVYGLVVGLAAGLADE
jgi:hypothetical protein